MPILTQRTVVRPEGSARLEAIAVEAAEQCERLSVPTIAPLRPLAAREPRAPLLFADERGEGAPLGRALQGIADADMLVGPEGGFAPEERAALLAAPGATPVSLGVRILRAETAAVYMLAAWQLAQQDEP